ncbi:hypothetical protein BEH94_04205 [Candidatus Altiarchaeales archaeon WOR_SM1_SCG]|nr:hypothetical protein BEH94_04205 [Candidatus Altiarchaeales archaeon WOR_SM1_SCG]
MVDKKQHFIGLKNPQHQQQDHMCIPSCIKTILDNQFNLTHKISLGKITKEICDPLPHEYRQHYPKFIPKGITGIRESLTKLLKDYEIVVNHKINLSKDNLLSLIESDTYVIVYLDLEEYFGYRGTKISEKSDEFVYHSVVVIGYDEDKQIFGIWDPLDPYEKKKYSFDDVRKIDYKTFLSCWDKRKSRGIYLIDEKLKQKRLLPYLPKDI